jgi:hypothetical protein
MTVTPKTMVRQIRVAQEFNAEQARIRKMSERRLAFTSETGVERPVRVEVWDNVEEDDPHCFICSRHTDHFAEHDDMVEAGYAQYESDGTVTWTEKGWNEYKR